LKVTDEITIPAGHATILFTTDAELIRISIAGTYIKYKYLYIEVKFRTWGIDQANNENCDCD